MRTELKYMDPKKLIKRTSFNERIDYKTKVIGNRQQTDYGFVVQGYKHKNFETQYIYIAADGATPAWLHPKKVRTVRVLTGIGRYDTINEDGAILESKPLAPGDEVVFLPTISYVLYATTALELFVTQEFKYEVNLQETKAVSKVVGVPSDYLIPITQSDKHLSVELELGASRSRSSRSLLKAQIEQLRGKESPNAPESVVEGRSTNTINIRPTTVFSDEDAG